MKSKVCKICNKTFFNSSSSKRNWERRLYCSRKCYGTTLKGKPVIAIGTHRSPETILKLRKSMKGKNKREKNWNWRGGITNVAEKLRKGYEYKIWRFAVFTRDNFTCKSCGQLSGNIQGHHILPYAKFPHLTFDISNGITLCRKCHMRLHFGKDTKWEYK